MDQLNDLLLIANQPQHWLVKDLILQGEQIMIAAAPKVGKSLLASQLALALASGDDFLGWQVDHPAPFLYFNLEIGRPMFGRRIQKQVAGLSKVPSSSFINVESGIHTINILDAKSRTDIADRIKQSKAELVIFDVLSRCHSACENSNSEMKDVLKELRLVCGGVTSVVIHHSRKPPQGQEEDNLGAYALRGASAVHGEVDLAITMAKRSGQGARYSVKFSARNIPEPDEMFLELDPATLRFSVGRQEQENKLVSVLNKAFSMAPAKQVHVIQQEVMTAYNVDIRQAQRLLGQAVAAGLISKPRRQGSENWYDVLNKVEIPCFDTLPATDSGVTGCHESLH